MTMVGRTEIERRLGYHPATDPAKVAAFELVRSQCTELAVLLDEVLPPGRELAEALTSVQTAQMYAIAAIACDQTGHEYPLLSRSHLGLSRCPHRVQYVGDGARGGWLECIALEGHPGPHGTSDGATFE